MSPNIKTTKQFHANFHYNNNQFHITTNSMSELQTCIQRIVGNESIEFRDTPGNDGSLILQRGSNEVLGWTSTSQVPEDMTVSATRLHKVA